MTENNSNRSWMIGKRTALTAIMLSVIGVLAFSYYNDAFALRVTLKRVVFEGPVRTEVLTIINNTPDEQTYRLGWKKLKMTEDQSLQNIPEGDEDISGYDEIRKMVRYAPRRIVLPPGASQQVRLMLRRPRDLADGEYRSHFWIQPEAEAVKFDTETMDAPAGASAVQIKMLTGLTLPVFVRQGDLNASAEITDARMAKADNGADLLQYTLHREGTRSLYGDIELTCVQPDGGENVVLQVRGIAVYMEVDKRMLTHRVSGLPDGGCRTMHMQYRADPEDRLFKGETLAEAQVAM